MYKVIVKFVDLKDDNHVYRVGDTFPRLGKKVSEARISELKSADNKRHRPLIEEVKNEAPKPVIEEIMPTPVEEKSETESEKQEKEVKPKRTSRKKK